MKKNGEFVGVDEKFIPEDEKYVDESLLGNREETKKIIKKVAKGIGIGYLWFMAFILIFIIGIAILCFAIFNKGMDIFAEAKDQIMDTYNKQSTSMMEESDLKIEEQYSMLEEYENKIKNMMSI